MYEYFNKIERLLESVLKHDLKLGQNVIHTCDWYFVYKIIYAKLGKPW